MEGLGCISVVFILIKSIPIFFRCRIQIVLVPKSRSLQVPAEAHVRAQTQQNGQPAPRMTIITSMSNYTKLKNPRAWL